MLRVIFLLVTLILPAWAQVHYPAPQGRVNDFAQVLDTSTTAQLQALVTEVEQQTTVEIAIVVVQTTALETPRQYAIELFKRWGVGKRGADNGVMILLALQERRVEIETGYGVEDILPDGKVGEIMRTTMTPAFKQNRWAEGLLAGTQQIARVLRTHYQVPQTPTPPASTSLPWREVIAGLGWVYFVCWIGFLLVQNFRRKNLSYGVLVLSTLPGVVLVFLAFFPFIVPLVFGLLALGKNVQGRCPKCGGWLSQGRRTLETPSSTHGGLRETVYDCVACGYHDVHITRLPRVSRRARGSGWAAGAGGFGGGWSGGFGDGFSGRGAGGSSSGGSSKGSSFGGGSSGGGGAGASF